MGKEEPSASVQGRCIAAARLHPTIQFGHPNCGDIRDVSGHVASHVNAIVCTGARKRATTMYAGKEKGSCRAAVAGACPLATCSKGRHRRDTPGCSTSSTLWEQENHRLLRRAAYPSRSGNHLVGKKVERSSLTARSRSALKLQEEDRILFKPYRQLKHPPTHQFTASLSVHFRGSALHRHPYHRYQFLRHCLYSNLRLFIYWHAFSLLACFAATGLCVRATVSEPTLSLGDMKPEVGDAQEQLSRHSTTAYTNPFLRHSRSSLVRLGVGLDSVCYVWSSATPSDLCKLNPWGRYQLLRKISIFSRDCTEENNIKAAQLFRLTTRPISGEADLRTYAHFLRADVEGEACILAPAGAHQCHSCFHKVISLFVLRLHMFYNISTNFCFRILLKS